MNQKNKLALITIAGLSLLIGESSVVAQEWYRMDVPDRIQSGLKENESRIYTLKPSSQVRQLPNAEPSDITRTQTELGTSFERNAVSALLLENGQVVFELYNQGGAANIPANAYSMTKSLTSLAVGEALCARKIKSLDDPAQMYVPVLEGTPYGRASLRQLLTYTSGAEDPGGDGYMGIHSRTNFNSMVKQERTLVDLIKTHSGESRFKPGEKFIYNGLDSQTLSLVIRSATGMPLPQWFETTVWQASGAESPAVWFVDKEGNGNAEVLFFGITRDFARVGQYMLERLTGVAGDTCIRDYLKEATKPLVPKGYWPGPGAPSWGFGFHTSADGTFWMSGFNGQRIGVSPSRKRVFVTTSNRNTKDTDSYALQMLVN